jgi:hypothetical protein
MADTKNTQGTIQLDAAALKHLNGMHRLGRIGIVGAFIIMLGMPTIAGLYFHAVPSFMEVMTAAIGLLALFVPGALGETFAYSPVIGSAYYLSQITGNVTNLKLPIARNLMKLMDVREGTEDGDIISSIAISVSSFVTIIIIVLGVVLLQPLQPVLNTPVVKTATKYIVPALFGSILLGSVSRSLGGGVEAEGRMWQFLVPALVIAAVNIVMVYCLNMGLQLSIYLGILELIMIPITWIWTKYCYTSGKIKIILPEDKKGKK